MRSRALSGLCVVTNRELIPIERFDQVMHRVLVGGARIVHYRDAGSDWGRRYHQAVALRDLCIAHDAILIVVDDVRLADESGAHGMHLDRNDIPVDTIREALGYDHVIGVSCSNSLPRARRAVQDGADYVLFGDFFPSRITPGSARAELALLGEAKDEFLVPVVATGGITPDNAGKLIDHGADMIAVSEAVFGPHDPEQTARRLAQMFEYEPPRTVEKNS